MILVIFYLEDYISCLCNIFYLEDCAIMVLLNYTCSVKRWMHYFDLLDLSWTFVLSVDCLQLFWTALSLSPFLSLSLFLSILSLFSFSIYFLLSLSHSPLSFSLSVRTWNQSLWPKIVLFFQLCLQNLDA